MRLLLLKLAVLLTNYPRYQPDIHWDTHVYVANIFRAWEYLFGKPQRVTLEARSTIALNQGKLYVSYELYTLEAVCAFIEVAIRGYLRLLYSFFSKPQAHADYRPVYITLGLLGVMCSFTTKLHHLPLFGIALAIGFDLTTNSANQASVSTYNWSHTCTGSQLYLTVGVGAENNATPANMAVTGITYNTVAMTKADEQDTTITPGGSADISSLWSLVNPATGAHSVAVTHTGTITGAVAGACSFTGADQTGNPHKAGGNKASGATATVALTSTVDGCMYVDVMCGSGSTNALTPDVSQTARFNVTSTGVAVIAGSTFQQTTAGAKTMQWTFTSEVWAQSALVLEPVQAATTIKPGTSLLLSGVGT